VGNPRHWASLDPRRPTKKVALSLDLAGMVRPFITPDDLASAEAVILQHTNLALTPSAR
jgi:hypothetical protein